MKLAFAFVIFVGLTQASAQESPPKPEAAPPAAPSDVSIHGYGDAEKTCMEWNDGCRTCRRGGAVVSCSNIGIACQPTAVKCTWPSPPIPPDPPK